MAPVITCWTSQRRWRAQSYQCDGEFQRPSVSCHRRPTAAPRVPGLATEAETMDLLVEKLKVMIPELLDANGHADGDEFPFELVSTLTAKAHRYA